MWVDLGHDIRLVVGDPECADAESQRSRMQREQEGALYRSRSRVDDEHTLVVRIGNPEPPLSECQRRRRSAAQGDSLRHLVCARVDADQPAAAGRVRDPHRSAAHCKRARLAADCDPLDVARGGVDPHDVAVTRLRQPQRAAAKDGCRGRGVERRAAPDRMRAGNLEQPARRRLNDSPGRAVGAEAHADRHTPRRRCDHTGKDPDTPRPARTRVSPRRGAFDAER
jgi:hypothetical protein